MNVERGIGRHRVGGWEFLPATGELRRRTDVRRLEPRAARTLELLCEANGEVVSQEQLIAGVWSGRSLSDNSVAVVIGQLRRALMMRRLLGRFGLTSPWSVELAVALLALLGGAALMPVLIFYAGVASVGRYEGASLGHLYTSFFTGLGQASIASWAVLLGPYGLYLLFKALRAWWQASARLA